MGEITNYKITGDAQLSGSVLSSVGRSAKRIGVTVAIVGTLIYLLACILLYVKQRSLIYFPTPESKQSEAASLELQSGGETLRLWTRTRGSRDAVIYFGGNAEDVGFTFPTIAKLVPDKDLYFVNYRGYGGSTGSPTEEGLFADSLAVYDLVQNDHDHIAVIGRSLGSGVAVYLASARKVDKLVLVTPYDSIENVAKNQFPFFPISLLLKDKFDSASKANSISAETLLIVAEKDDVIPRRNSDALATAFGPNHTTVKIISGATHNSISFKNEYSDALKNYLN